MKALRQILISTSFLLIGIPVFAQDTVQSVDTVGSGGLQNPLGSTSDLPTLLNAILNFITTQIGPVVITLMLVYCGFLFVTAQGNEEKVRNARTALMWTVIGALLLLGAATIGGVIKTTVGTL